MTSLAARLARPEILALPEFDIAANANDAFGSDAIKLDANENPYAPLAEGALAAGLNRYPEPQPARLKGLEAQARAAEMRGGSKGSGLAELVEAPSFFQPSQAEKKKSPSTSSGKAELGVTP